MSWTSFISSAEKFLGGPVPLINFNYFMSAEANTFIEKARRLATSSHPFFAVLKSSFSYSDSRSIFTKDMIPLSFKEDSSDAKVPGGILLMLLGEAYCNSDIVKNNAKINNLKLSSRKIAEIYETSKIAVYLQKSVVNQAIMEEVKHSYKSGWFSSSNPEKSLKDLRSTNKMAVLSSDVLLSHVAVSLAKLRNPEIVKTVSASLGALLRSNYHTFRKRLFRGHDNMNCELEAIISDWKSYLYVAHGMLIKSCAQSINLINVDKAYTHDQFLVQWSVLNRIINEREWIKSIIENGCMIPKKNEPKLFDLPSQVHFYEQGLLQPSLADALIVAHPHKSTESLLYRSLDIYNEVVAQIYQQLMYSLDSLKSDIGQNEAVDLLCQSTELIENSCRS